jgi:hypothetical protein
MAGDGEATAILQCVARWGAASLKRKAGDEYLCLLCPTAFGAAVVPYAFSVAKPFICRDGERMSVAIAGFCEKCCVAMSAQELLEKMLDKMRTSNAGLQIVETGHA